MNIAICFLSKQKDHFNYKKLLEISNTSKKHNINVFQYINDESQYYNSFIREKTIYFSYDNLKEKYFPNIINDPLLYNKDFGIEFLPWIDMYINNKNTYDFFLFWKDELSCFINNDVNLFDLIDFECEILFQNKRLLVNTEDVKSKYKNSINNIDFYKSNHLYHGQMNIYGAIPNFINNFIYLMKNKPIHYKILFPLLCSMNEKYKVKEIDKYVNCHFGDEFIHDRFYELVYPIENQEQYNIIDNLNKQHSNGDTITNICICVCFYNTNPKYLEECFKSIDDSIWYFYRYYTNIPIEVHVMDDGSTNIDTITMWEEILQKYSYIKWWKHEHNTTLSTAINDLNQYTPENALVIYIDSDDMMVYNRIKVQYEIFTKYDNWKHITLCATNTILPNHIIKKFEEKREYFKYSIYNYIDDMKENIVCHPTIAYKINHIRRFNIKYDDNLKCTQDSDFYWQILSNNLKILLIPDALTDWRIYNDFEKADPNRNYFGELYNIIRPKYNKMLII